MEEKPTPLDLSSWKRKEHFNFYKDFDLPFFNITGQVDITSLLNWAKKNQYPFSLACLFLTQWVANSIEEFRLRIIDGIPHLFKEINAGTTMLLPNKTYKFSYLKNHPEAKTFISEGKKDMEAQAKIPGLSPNGRLDMIYYSFIPWVSLTSFSHAKMTGKDPGIPRIVFGKFETKENRTFMPLSVEVHHALVDGYHVGQFFESFEKFQGELP